MRVIETQMERAGRGRIRIVTTLELDDVGDSSSQDPELGEGPAGDPIPDRIVRCLIERGPGSVPLAEIQQAIGGNPGTVNRQTWTLATNAPDLQHRHRGWVTKADRGRYALTLAARARIGQ